MTYVCFSPSLFDCKNSIDAVKDLANKINILMMDLKSLNIESFFTNEYVAEILSHDWPWNNPDANRYLREIQIIISAKAKVAIHTKKTYCCCRHSSSNWSDVLFTASQNERIGIIAFCDNLTIDSFPICKNNKDLSELNFPSWFCKIDDVHKNKIPLSGNFAYSPLTQKNGKISRIKCYCPKFDKTGYIDKDNNLWVWQDEEGGHWDVFLRKDKRYIRVGITGNIINKKFKL